MAGLTSTLVLCMVLGSCLAQRFLFEPVPGDCKKFRFSYFDNGFSIEFDCPEGKVFSTYRSRCVPETSYLNDQCPLFRTASDVARVCDECIRERRGGGEECIFANREGCATFYNCSKTDEDPFSNLPRFGGECTYPNEFNTVSRRCEDFSKVRCGQRKEPKHPCDYATNRCSISAHCAPCSYRFPSCVEKEDGVQEWEGRAWTPYYVECKGQRTLNFATCPSSRNGRPRIFSPSTRRCDDLVNVPRKFGGLLDGEVEE